MARRVKVFFCTEPGCIRTSTRSAFCTGTPKKPHRARLMMTTDQIAQRAFREEAGR